MSAIPCASVSLKTMSDGTLRISFDVEPMHAQDAFRLFAAPGTPAALAALQVGYAAKSDIEIPAPVAETGNPIAEKTPLGPLAYWLVLRCKEPEFWRWLRSLGHEVRSETRAAAIVRDMLGLATRKDLDGDPDGVEIFHKHMRGSYSKWCAARGVVS